MAEVLEENKKSLHTTLVGRKDVTAEVNGGAIITDVLILQEGEDKCGDYFDLPFLEDYVRIANAKPTGVKCRLGHPDFWSGGKDPITTFLGNIKNHRISANAEGKKTVIADVHISPVAKVSPDGDNFTFIVEMAKNHPEDFGLSIHYLFQFKEIIATDAEGNEYPVYGQTLGDIIACDFVDRPAVNDGLYKSEDHEDKFFNLIKNKIMSVKNWKDKLKSLIEGKKSLELTDANGGKLVVETDAGTAVVGDKVTVDGVAPADGDIVMSDGSTIKVAAGVITEIVPKDTSTGAGGSDKPTPEAATKAINEMQKSFDEKLKAMEARLETKYKSDLKRVTDAIMDMADKHTSLAELVKSDYTPEEAEKVGVDASSQKKKESTVRTGFKKDGASKN